MSDDGYFDNDQPAPAILHRLDETATFCASVDAVEMRETWWRSRLRYAFFTTRRKGWNDQHGGSWLLGCNDQHGGGWPLENQQQREEAFVKACDFCAALPGNLQEQFLRAIESELDVRRDRVEMKNADVVHAQVARGDVVVSRPVTHPNVAQVDVHAAAELPKLHQEQSVLT